MNLNFYAAGRMQFFLQILRLMRRPLVAAKGGNDRLGKPEQQVAGGGYRPNSFAVVYNNLQIHYIIDIKFCFRGLKMADVYETFRDIGIIPVVAIEDASKAANLAHALVKGGLPASEVTFRTACAARPSLKW